MAKFNHLKKSMKKNKALECKKGSGRIAKKVKSKVIKAIERKFNHRHGCSQRKIASEFNITHQYVSKILKALISSVSKNTKDL